MTAHDDHRSDTVAFLFSGDRESELRDRLRGCTDCQSVAYGLLVEFGEVRDAFDAEQSANCERLIAILEDTEEVFSGARVTWLRRGSIGAAAALALAASVALLVNAPEVGTKAIDAERELVVEVLEVGSGLTREHVLAGIEAKRDTLVRCPRGAGVLEVVFTVRDDGLVDDLKVRALDGDVVAKADCVARVMKRAAFDYPPAEVLVETRFRFAETSGEK